MDFLVHGQFPYETWIKIGVKLTKSLYKIIFRPGKNVDVSHVYLSQV